ncbi:GNAT family N-acetyltransferase [Micromonospora sp. R77]|uniref:GNAT family N-acetyltransferase n=1 Tax=Micromonospora sp. R77 TaxID=2925836 RepID=UPI001F616715|nr:GNAT family N-acetyltransferase [Micromonospora sp. R77]MCI4063878.1 GNAT family N-acetyltransferase [Micromonospora sp. R77]
MTESTEPRPQLDLGATLRALRREADLSQRQLAARSGVPQATIARMESGLTTDPRFRTFERLLTAAGGCLTVTLAAPAAPAAPAGTAGTAVVTSASPDVAYSLPVVPHEAVRDAAGRHCPAHLDARPVREPRDWPGAWWSHWYDLPPGQWPLPLPAATFVRDRGERDRHRRREQVRREVRVRRFTDIGLPATSWRFLAELPDGELVGELRAHERSVDLLLGYELGDRRELVLDGVLVGAEHRLLGIGRRLVEAIRTEMARIGVGTVHAVAEFGGAGFLVACGFQVAWSRPTALRWETAAGGTTGQRRA